MSAKRRLVIVGNGMGGARLVEDVITRGGGDLFDIAVFGDEPHGNYNRILLSSVLAGDHDPGNIFLNPMDWYRTNGVTLYASTRVEAVDLPGRRVQTSSGIVDSYDELVIATGSSPLIPPIHGVFGSGGSLTPGVFLFRTLDDCRRILDHAPRCRSAAVIGGGLLGLEAAKGLAARGLDVHVIHLGPSLMETQLDVEGGAVLLRQLEHMGLHVHVDKATTAVLGAGRVSGLVFKDGSLLECDMVVLAAGIRPNVDLAVRAGLEIDRGIVVGDDLACRNAPHVYAIGECAQHRGQVYGLVGPVWEQARVLADRLTARDPLATYQGTRVSTKLKVAGLDLAVMGAKEPTEDDDEVVSYAEPSRGIYKKLIIRGDRIAGGILMGDRVVVPPIMQAFADATRLGGQRAEWLFPMDFGLTPSEPSTIPDTAMICDCNAVTKAAIIEAVLQGARTVGAVSSHTRACTGCGSCRPEVERIIQLACEGLTAPDVLTRAAASEQPGPSPIPTDARLVPQTKIERIKTEKDGLDILSQVPQLAREGWQAISDGDRERLKWAGVFFRRQTPGQFMMRVRMPNGRTSARQLRTLAEISHEYGPGFLDITTRQQVQLRGFGIEHVPEIWERLDKVGLASLQTGMDNVRNVIGCPLAGLSPHELLDASPIVGEFTDMFLNNREFTNLPRKFNVAISGCRQHCVHAETQDLALTPAVRDGQGGSIVGFNVAVGGKMGSGGYRAASSLDLFVRPEEAAAVCAAIVLVFRDHGPRAVRTRARLAFLVDDWGVARFRQELVRRLGRSLLPAGTDARTLKASDHLGILPQKQGGRSTVGLAVPVGRITTEQLFEVARLADTYGTGDVRVTTSQNLIVPNVADDCLSAFAAEPLLRELQHDPPGAIRGLVSCTGIDYCHFALIETKELAIRTADHLVRRLPHGKRLTMHWSGCPAGCGNHAAADIGLLGKNVKIDGETVDAVDVFVGGRAGPDGKPGVKVLEDVPCADLPQVLERVIPYLSGRRTVHAADSAPPRPVALVPQPPVPERRGADA
ncbi:MAG: nitrite reductase large subunit [Acidobacteria bacterium]|nr:MAG: nitrite reductase large subunit [Acidobacteriota bacterium]